MTHNADIYAHLQSKGIEHLKSVYDTKDHQAALIMAKIKGSIEGRNSPRHLEPLESVYMWGWARPDSRKN